MSVLKKAASKAPLPVRERLTHTGLYLPDRLNRDRRPIALVFGNCQAEAVRRILATHPGCQADFRLMRIPAVHEITPDQLARLQRRLPEVGVFIAQDVKNDYRGLALGTEQLAGHLPGDALVLRYPVAYFEGLYPFQVYVNELNSPTGYSAPITDYHDSRLLYAAREGWSEQTTVQRLAELTLDPDLIRENSERSLQNLATREAGMTAQLAPLVRAHPSTSFRTINHPVNGLVTDVARQVLAAMGYADAEQVLQSRQTYLDHLQAPREAQIVRALGGEPDADEQNQWVTAAGRFTMQDVVAAHLGLYRSRPDLLESGVTKHAQRLEVLAGQWA